MKLMVLETGGNQETKERKESVYTLEELEEEIMKLGGTTQIWVNPDYWVIDDFRKLCENESPTELVGAGGVLLKKEKGQ